LSGSVCVIIVNFRTAGLAISCIESIGKQTGDLPSCRVVVVDNDSGDGSVTELESAISKWGWHGWVDIVDSKRNGGFAFGNNRGIEEVLHGTASPDYFLLLNPDTVACDGAIRTLLDFMENRRDVGIAGSSLQNVDGGAECSAHNAPSPLGELVSGARLGLLSRLMPKRVVTPPLRQTAHECDWVSGASMIVRREVVESLSGLDEGFFLYFEEVDFCSRARRAGWKIWFVPQSRVVHLEGAATGIRQLSRRRATYWYDSRRRYFVKHFGVTGWIVADVLWAVGRASLALRRALRPESGGTAEEPLCFARDLLWGDVRALLTGQVFRIARSQSIIKP
jgi:N-acetylglucosaminyl-diphospho-decaprenol L-rhamnosyltransferase